MKKTNIIIRVSDREKEEIKATAEAFEMSMSEYILMLHRKNIAKEP
jgi:antitoxin component of RelBE/YafQ-DinJ toxin-antitoxin module